MPYQNIPQTHIYPNHKISQIYPGKSQLSYFSIPDISSQLKNKYLSTIDALNIVSRELQIPIHLIHLNSRKREIITARQITHLILRKYSKLSITSIGQLIGKKHHSTVLHSCKNISNLLETDPKLLKSLSSIEIQIKKLYPIPITK